MKLSRLMLAAFVAALAVVASACGGGGDGGGDVPENAVAVVDGTEIARKELDELMEQAKKASELQNQEFPNVGTPEYRDYQTQYLAYLVQRTAFEHEAEKLGIKVTEKEVDKEFNEFVKTRYDGDRKKFDEALKEQGFTLEGFRKTLRTSALTQKLYDAVTKDVEVLPTEVVQYYQTNQQSYSTPESRDVRHILIAEKKGTEVDFEKSETEADRLYAELQSGGDFAALAKSNSDDTGSAVNGGKLTISRGETVPEFDKTAFDLKEGVVSKPVKTTYGYHLIEALSPVRKAKTTPLEEVRGTIRVQLLQEKRQTYMAEWAEKIFKEYESKVSYATGFQPPQLPDATDTEGEPATE
jgi:foldase protein PrsA